MKVLIVTYYWPPAGGPGVQRVLKFAKYFPEFDWQPIILTVKAGSYSAIDPSLSMEIPKECRVFKTNALQPFDLYQRFTGGREGNTLPNAILSESEGDWKKRLARWMRLSFFIPDARIGWLPYALKAGKKIIQSEKPEVILSSSPPPTVHLIAKGLAKTCGLSWIADFRDPWTDIYHYDTAMRNVVSRNVDLRLEKKTLESANAIVTVSEHFAKLLKEKTKNPPPIHIITNGFDPEDLPRDRTKKTSDKFIIAHAGKFNHQQNPENLWKIIAQMRELDQQFANDLQILLIGSLDNKIITDINRYGLDSSLEATGYVAHRAALKRLQEASILLLLVPNTKKNQGIVPGKLFEYLALKKSIFIFGPPDGDAAKIVKDLRMGENFDFNEEENLRKALQKKYNFWKESGIVEAEVENIKDYSRRNLTSRLVSIMEDIL